ncbi:MAG: hypothetical protein L3K24_13580 [Gammaproteobacteria bacterium]|nr:hypothetical protein [Gammaproteobacteria bacterium]
MRSCLESIGYCRIHLFCESCRLLCQLLPATLRTCNGDGIGLICQAAGLHEGVIVEVEIATEHGRDVCAKLAF